MLKYFIVIPYNQFSSSHVYKQHNKFTHVKKNVAGKIKKTDNGNKCR